MSQRYYIAMDDAGKAFIAHHGIKGQKWGVRRFQDSNGELTAAGRARYNTDSAHSTAKSLNQIVTELMHMVQKQAELFEAISIASIGHKIEVNDYARIKLQYSC